MTPERWQRIDQLVQEALSLDDSERSALLDAKCHGDTELRREVQSLIDSAAVTLDFLKQNALEDGAGLFNTTGSSLPTDHQVGHYVIQKPLGAGGMGEVYLARDLKLGRLVALKVLDAELTTDETTRSRFFREARLASTLDHPNICTIHEVGEADGRLYIAMQYVEGMTLRQVLGGQPLELDSLLSIALQIADAISTAHAQSIIHRDIKPGNIVVSARGQAKVLDFGLAKLLETDSDHADAHLTVTNAVMGTPTGMSPEQARGERVDHRSDIFSFGIVLYEMATGSVPFTGRSVADVISAVLKEHPKPVNEVNKKIPEQLSRIIERALAKEPVARYQSMSEVVTELRLLIKEAGALDRLFDSKGGLLPVVPRELKRPQSRRMLISILAMGGLVLVMLAIAFAISRRITPEPTKQIKSIAVLPFKPLVPDTRDEVLEMGMSDTLIARLGNIHQIEVRPISSVRKYTGLEQDALAAGREQRVEVVLDGSIQRAADDVRVTVRLLRVADGKQLWTETFNEKFTNIFVVQDRVAEKVVKLLTVKLAEPEQTLLTRRDTNDGEAYQLYLKGRFHLHRLTDEGFRKARDYFQQAIDRDPNYASAYAGLADAYNRLSGWNAVAPRDGFPLAKKAAQKALELDESHADAHTQLAVVKLLYDWDWSGAESEFKRAIEISPGNSETRYLYGLHLWAMGRFDESLTELKLAEKLDPVSLEKVGGIGDLFYYQRSYDKAIEQYGKALEMDPNSGYAHWALGNAYLRKGMHEQAVVEFKKSIPLSGDSPDEPAALAYAYAVSGKGREARKILNELQQRSKHSYVSPTLLGFIHDGLGEKDQAFANLDQAYRERDFLLIFLKVDPMFDGLRSDPRFSDLMARVGLPQ